MWARPGAGVLHFRARRCGRHVVSSALPPVLRWLACSCVRAWSFTSAAAPSAPALAFAAAPSLPPAPRRYPPWPVASVGRAPMISSEGCNLYQSAARAAPSRLARAIMLCGQVQLNCPDCPDYI